MTNTHQVRLQSGEIGSVAITLKPREIVGRYVMLSFEVDGEVMRKYGIVAHVYEQLELNV